VNQGEIEALSVITEQAASRLEKEIMLDIVRRIKANENMTSSAEYQIQRLRQLGDSEEYIRLQIQIYLRSTNEEMERIFRDVPKNEYHKFDKIFEETGVDRIPFMDNTELQGLITSTLRQTGNTFQNITNTLGFQVMKDGKRIFTPLSQYYQETVDNAVLGMTTGSFSYDVVLKKVVMEMTKSGVRTVDYASGRSYRIESASRTALMTGFRQITGYMNEQTAQELGTNDYETTYHIGARPSHQIWQGKVFSYQELESVCGLGSVTGLCGANCYHWYEPFILGVSVRNYTDEQLDQMIAEENKPRYYEGKEYTTYTALQKQRNMELLMRKQRQDIVLLKEGEGDEFDILTAQIKYRTTMNQYVEFSKAMNLPQQRERIYMDGLGRVGRTGVIPKPKRKEVNTGAFKELKVPMQKKHIDRLTARYGVIIDDLNIRIQRDEGLLNLAFCGSTDYNSIGRIDLFPNAFRDEETLLRTIIHERCHVLQLKKHGKEYTQKNLDKMEEEAYKFEDFWYNIVRKRVKQ